MRILTSILVVVVLLVGDALLILHERGMQLNVSQQQLQQQLETHFPIKQTYLVAFNLTLSDPQLHFDSNSDRLTFSTTARAQVPFQPRDALAGTAEISGHVRYDRIKGTFMLDDSRVDSLTIPGLPEKYHQQVIDLASKGLSKYVTNRPLYTLDTNDKRQAVAKWLVKDVRVSNGSLVVQLGV